MLAVHGFELENSAVSVATDNSGLNSGAPHIRFMSI